MSTAISRRRGSDRSPEERDRKLADGRRLGERDQRPDRDCRPQTDERERHQDDHGLCGGIPVTNGWRLVADEAGSGTDDDRDREHRCADDNDASRKSAKRSVYCVRTEPTESPPLMSPSRSDRVRDLGKIRPHRHESHADDERRRAERRSERAGVLHRAARCDECDRWPAGEEEDPERDLHRRSHSRPRLVRLCDRRVEPADSRRTVLRG